MPFRGPHPARFCVENCANSFPPKHPRRSGTFSTVFTYSRVSIDLGGAALSTLQERSGRVHAPPDASAVRTRKTALPESLFNGSGANSAAQGAHHGRKFG